MSRVCTVCTLKNGRRAAIDAAIVAGEAKRRLATQYGVSECAVRRHAAKHLPAALARAQDAAEVASGDALLEQVRDLQAKSLTILDRAEQAGDLRTAVAAIREARGNLELLAKLVGELAAQPTMQQNVVAVGGMAQSAKAELIRHIEALTERVRADG